MASEEFAASIELKKVSKLGVTKRAVGMLLD